MRNVVPRRALVRRSRNVLMGAALIFLVGLLALVIALFMRSVPLVVASNPNYAAYQGLQGVLLWLGGLGIFAGIALAIRALTWKRENPLALQAAEMLGEYLDDRYVFIRNLSRRGIGYVDAVLVGPPGVLVFRITQRAGIFYNEGSRWMKQQDKGRWQALRWSPSKEAVDDVKKVRQFLSDRGLPGIPVFAVVLFTTDEPATIVTTDQPLVPVLQPHELSYGLDDGYFSKRDRLAQLTANKVATYLQR